GGCFARIGQRVAVLVDHPTFRYCLASLGGELHLPVGRNGGRHVQQNRLRPLSGRDSNSNRVRAQEKLCASPGCHVIGVSHCCIEPNHVVCQRHHRVDTRDSGVIGV